MRGSLHALPRRERAARLLRRAARRHGQRRRAPYRDRLDARRFLSPLRRLEAAERLAAHQVLTGPMDRDGIRRAIIEPARTAGLTPEEGRVDTILDDYDVVRQASALPLLELALLELWERQAGTGLTKEAYAGGGGVQGASATRAEALYTLHRPQSG